MSNLFKIVVLATIFLFVTVPVLATDTAKIREQILQLAKEISLGELIEGEDGGYGSEGPGHNFLLFTKLNEQATDTELTELANYPDAKVKAYSFWALAKRNYQNIKKVFLSISHDKTEVLYQIGCFVTRHNLNEFCLMILTPGYIDITCFKLTREEVELFKRKITVGGY